MTSEASPSRLAAGDRGRLVIGRNVVEKIARQAASEVATAGGRTGGVLGIGSHTDMSALPEADVELSSRTASIDLDISVAYPTPLRQTTERVRQHVMDRVAQLAGVEVSRIDITVTALHSATVMPEALR
ncbi:MAG TPA: Asp23/Gls24 family envelope stress response protein [Microlunatus sp.]|nr:Asp23/Gls24 family envelope stress response protein [Microlunatus sp.]